MFPGETVLTSKRPNKHFGEFKVMSSQGGAGFYIGTMYLDCGDPNCHDCDEYAYGRPRTEGRELDYNSRETDYFATKEEADKALEDYKKTGYLENQRY